MSVNATAIWRVRPSGSNTNGGGYDPGISGAATDYSQHDAAQATGSHGTATGTTTFTDTVAANFTSAMVGNALWIASGAGFTVGAYFIITFNSSTSVVLDRSPGTGTVAVWALGGGWADPVTNANAASAPVVPGNTVYVLGSGTPNPSSYTFDYSITTSGITASGNATAGDITWANDPATPGYVAPPNTTGGMPVIKLVGASTDFTNGSSYFKFLGLWFVFSAGSQAILANGGPGIMFGCVGDYNGQTNGVFCYQPSNTHIVGCEFFSSVTAGAGYQFAIGVNVASVVGCNIHDINQSVAILSIIGNGSLVVNNIIAKTAGGADAIGSNGATGSFVNNTIDGNSGNGINLASQSTLAISVIMNNIISNQTGAGKSGITIGAGTAVQNSSIIGFADYNVFYNNTANYNAISAGPHDTALGSNPYVGQSTENYSLA